MNAPNDTRSVATDALATLGTIIDDTQKRDAIHLAVEPVIAGCHLRAGDHVTVTDGIALWQPVGEGMGIVDPFLLQDVETGQRFWFVMYPRQVRSLRHVWSHPAFPDEPVALALTAPSPAAEKASSEAWLRQYAMRVNSSLPDDGAYETLMDDIHRRTIVYHGTDMHSLGELKDADELRRHASIVLGYEVNWSEFEYFSCSC